MYHRLYILLHVNAYICLIGDTYRCQCVKNKKAIKVKKVVNETPYNGGNNSSSSREGQNIRGYVDCHPIKQIDFSWFSIFESKMENQVVT